MSAIGPVSVGTFTQSMQKIVPKGENKKWNDM